MLEDAGLVQTRRDGRYKFHDLDTRRSREITERWPHAETERSLRMRIVVTSVLVDDQEKALRFYTDVLGFEKKQDIPLGEARG